MPVLSQNYQTFQPETDYYVTGKNTGNINTVFIDSVQIVMDTTFLYNYYNLRNPVDTSELCYNPQGASWIGPKVIIASNGDNLFLNRFGDSILIKSQALISEWWKFFDYPNGNYIEARITSIDTMQLYGSYDSVKTISLTLFNQEGNKIESSLNNVRLMLSKNNGLIQLPDFYYFPDYPLDDPLFSLSPDTLYYLTGLFNSPAVTDNITGNEIFDFDVGDEFHTEYIHTPLGPYTQIKEFFIKKVLDKTVSANNDTITCVFSVCGRKEKKEPDSELEIEFQNDTISETYLLSSGKYKLLDYFPDESFFCPETAHYEFMDMSVSNNYNKRPVKFFPQIGYQYIKDECFIMALTTPGQPYRFYIEGCGGEYYIGNYDTEWGDHYLPVYFKKGEETWGNPLDCDYLLGKNDLLSPSVPDYTLFPNPADRFVLLRFNDDLQQSYAFEVYDYSGRLLIKTIIKERETRINVSDLKSGFYLYKLSAHDNIKKAGGKLLIQINFQKL
jgi:hypothetical protein